MDAVQTAYTSNDLNQYSYALRSDGGALFPMYDADGNMTLLDVAGDMDCDGVVNPYDIDPFTLAVTNAALYQQQYPDCEILHADLNGDGAVNALDIDYLTDIIIAGGSGTRFEWDGENRLVRVAPAAPYDYQPAVEYPYDYRGRLIARIAVYWDPEQSDWVESGRREFVWSGWLLLAELDADDQPVREYTWGLDLAGQNGQLNSLESAGGVGGLLAVHDLKDTPDPGNDVNYAYAYDGNGNVVQILDWAATSASTVRKARYEYDPYGNAIPIFDVGMYNRQPFRFSTKIWDADVGMVYYGYRWYWPTVGRWISRDPIPERGAMLVRQVTSAQTSSSHDPIGKDTQFYAYVRNRTTDSVDPIGLCPIPQAGEVTWNSIGMNPSPKYFKTWGAELSVEIGAAGGVARRLLQNPCCSQIGVVQMVRETFDGGPTGKWVLDTGWSNKPLYPHGWPLPPASTLGFGFRDQPGWNPPGDYSDNSFKHEFETCVVCMTPDRGSWRVGCNLGCIRWGYEYMINQAPPPAHVISMWVTGCPRVAGPPTSAGGGAPPGPALNCTRVQASPPSATMERFLDQYR
jgi:RHS repeat-associated protein